MKAFGSPEDLIFTEKTLLLHNASTITTVFGKLRPMWLALFVLAWNVTYPRI